MEQKSIESYLAEENILSEDILNSVRERQQDTGQSLVSILKSDGLITDNQLTKVVAFANQIEFIELTPDMVDPMTAHLVDYDMVGMNNLIPLRTEGNKLYVAMASPMNLLVRDQIETKTGYSVIPLAATAEAVSHAIKYHFNIRNVTKQDIVSMRLKQSSSTEKQAKKAKAKSQKIADAPVTRLVSSIINGAIDARASDIHIEPQEPDIRVRYRVDGILRDAIEVPSQVQQEVVSHIKILADMDISEKRIPQDGHITTNFKGKEYDLRISSLPAVGGEKIVIRILDKSSGTWKLDEVVTSPEDNKKFKSMIENPYGMLLLTGPTGSGKTTTLYAVLQALNKPGKNIVTIEDPVEYRLSGITQVQVKPIAGMTFASGLRSILRQDPDIILVGEIRDLETAEIAVSAALTGHLVLSTLHTNDATGAISRLINLGIPKFLVASALLGTVAQRLIRICCKKCSEPYQPSQEELQSLFDNSKESQDITFYRSKGCNSCYHTGYHGRKAIYEILTISHDISKMISNGASDDDIKNQAAKEGMKTLKNSAVQQILAGNTSLQEIMRVVDVRDN